MSSVSTAFDLGVCSAISARLEKRGVSRDALLQAYSAAMLHGTSFCDELVQQRGVPEKLVYQAIADFLAVEFAEEVHPSRIFVSGEEKPSLFIDVGQITVLGSDGETCLYIAPTENRIKTLLDHLGRSPRLRKRIRICTPGFLKQIMRQRHQKELIARAHEMTPNRFSAARILDTPQAFFIAMTLYAFIASMFNWPTTTLLVIHVFLTLFFFGCVLIRLFAAVGGKRLQFPEIRQCQPRNLPVYSVLVPLYREQDVVGQLIVALGRLNWPKSKLDIKLICEKDDFDTLAAIRREKLPSNFELVLVPSGGPRTKPKALNYALQFARGEIVAVFDAEDRPHPDQLLEAWQTFEEGGDGLACVQAPLIIGNFRQNFLTRMFAFEYAALFRGLLPWLASHGLVIPLGGTSNHFRRRCIEEVGGWDAYNVTEDADLGVRLARFGYRIGVIARGTIEDAPADYHVWRKQRTRWLKGWMQTWLVHGRRPYSTWQQLGWFRFTINQIYTLGIIGSALLHPFMLLMFLILLVSTAFEPLTSYRIWLLALDVNNIVLAYLSFYLLGARTMEPTEIGGYTYFLSIPVYWVLISISAWRALGQLVHKPHLWEKTPHQPSLFYISLEDEVRRAEPRPMMD
ncbi:cellulose synthase/poly-beta-1,6-N-acetylglucosamine synthase-like glycosyltransferase [Ochrobactrum daejeonense]|uniref:Cellulose synthase/poly-beta-1,6-N-acetylglucosamine synthase-like glycosyltransferase n=1 Tax=Brucella daejeonensis TaxID=659015 RepID=A0A7W9AY38_9HYPH|nr:glycosyltransferase family 2 protein [Brucella daejeonensis]MBB5702364.1 cellulose synthase/poly-beta-1,6-N-acetylglucosamine synthase-like glycosyltransferase [Brucella daejeonensis]